MYKISIYGCAMFKKLVCQWVNLQREIPSCRFHVQNCLSMNVSQLHIHIRHD